jgi:hypothetical protein
MGSLTRRFLLLTFAWVSCALAGGGCDRVLGLPDDYALCGPAGNGGCEGGGNDGGRDAPDG